jgi:hypothetical protein
MISGQNPKSVWSNPEETLKQLFSGNVFYANRIKSTVGAVKWDHR